MKKVASEYKKSEGS